MKQLYTSINTNTIQLLKIVRMELMYFKFDVAYFHI